MNDVQKRDSVIKKSKVWGKSWFILSALMNAISLINIGKDLKIALFRWAAFFESAFELVKKITDVILSPFLFIFGEFGIEMPLPVKNIFFFSSLLMTTFFRAWAEKNKDIGIGVYSEEKQKINRRPYLVPVTKFIFSLWLGFCAGIIASAVTWVGYIVIETVFIAIVTTILILFFLVISIEFGKANNELSLFKRNVRKYMFAVFIILFLICLINYFYIAFMES